MDVMMFTDLYKEYHNIGTMKSEISVLNFMLKA